MNMDDSVLLTTMRDEFNRRAAADPGKTHDLDDLLYECLTNPNLLWPEWESWAKAKTYKRLRIRAHQAEKAKRHLQKRYASAFRAMDAAVAAAQFVNESLVDSMHGSDMLDKSKPLLGVQNEVGGPLSKHLTLIGMHARMITITSEILLLLKVGFPEGAAARARTLYELVVKALVITLHDAPHRSNLAERYYVSGLLEYKRATNNLDSDGREILRRAQRRWGRSLFLGDNNWALPAMGESYVKRQVTFADLENAIGTDYLRHMYLECNEAVHAGALKILGSLNFRRTYLYSTFNAIDLISTGRIGQASIYYLEMATFEITRRLTFETEDPDTILHMTDFMVNARLANRLFYEGYSRVSKRSSGQSKSS